jgi:hypothetical protein
MGNLSKTLAYPVVAGVVLTAAAARRGSGDGVPVGRVARAGEFTETAGFLRDERALLGVLTDYPAPAARSACRGWSRRSSRRRRRRARCTC